MVSIHDQIILKNVPPSCRAFSAILIRSDIKKAFQFKSLKYIGYFRMLEAPTRSFRWPTEMTDSDDRAYRKHERWR